MKNILATLFLVLAQTVAIAQAHYKLQAQTDTDLTFLSDAQAAALERIKELSDGLQQSHYYKTLPPGSFTAQLTDRVMNPYKLNQGKTSFCWAAAPIAYMYDHFPLQMAEAVFRLYTNGVFCFNNGKGYIHLKAHKKTIGAVGSATFCKDGDPLKGKLVDQMVFLVFADNYKCWLNVDRRFDPGDQAMLIWAGGTLSKERKVWKDFNFKVKKHGYDIYWGHKNKGACITEALEQNKVVIAYVNSPCFNKKWDRLRAIKRKPPFILTGTHYILMTDLVKTKGGYKISFWDDDGFQECVMSYDRFQRSVFGLAVVSQAVTAASLAKTYNSRSTGGSID